MNKLFLDDYRIPSDAWSYTYDKSYIIKDWDVVKNYDEFVSYITDYYKNNNEIPDVISFDHDLADIHYIPNSQKGEILYDQMTEKTGFHCAKWFIEFIIDNKIEKLPEIKVHSMNPVGKENIISLFKTFNKYF